MKKHMLFWGSYFFARVAMATSLGGVSENVIEPMSFLTKTMYAMSYVAGGCFLIGALLQYKQHRDNPQQTRIGVPITWAILGALLIGIPLLTTLYSESSGFAD